MSKKEIHETKVQFKGTVPAVEHVVHGTIEIPKLFLYGAVCDPDTGTLRLSDDAAQYGGYIDGFGKIKYKQVFGEENQRPISLTITIEMDEFEDDWDAVC